MSDKPEWQWQAEKLAELYGMSFVIFRNGKEPECADIAKFAITFTGEGGYRIRDEREQFREEMDIGARITSHRFIPKVR